MANDEMGRSAVLLDRDGTINEEVEYLSGPEELKLFPGTARAIRLLNENGFLMIVISNQSGIGRGYFTEKNLEKVHRKLQDKLAEEGAFVDAIYYCPHRPDEACDCRKPQPGLIMRAAGAFKLDLRSSYTVGDKLSDIEMGRRAGCRTILVLTGYGKETRQRLKSVKPDFVASDLFSAVNWILQRKRSEG